MRKLVILAIALSINITAFGQRVLHTTPIDINSFNDCNFSFLHGSSSFRTTGFGDTSVLSNIPVSSSLVIYPAGVSDSGYLTGTDIWNDVGFAESYSINGEDSSLVVIGVVALFKGTVTDTSSFTVTFDAWDEAQNVIRPTFLYSGIPNDCLDSLVVPANQLGIGTTTDTIKTFLFPMATDTVGSSSADVNYVGSSFFVGYTINYNFGLLTGDTLGLACSMNGVRSSTPPVYSIGTFFDTVINAEGTGDSLITVIDTIVNVQNATEFSDYTWHDNYTDNDSLFNDLAIYPIVVITGGATGVTSVSRKDLTFFGNYPNPAVDYTNIKFSLLQPADVTIQIMDMKGGVISTITNPALSMGTHIVPVSTSSMPSGDYLYFIHTSAGDGIAGKMTILK